MYSPVSPTPIRPPSFPHDSHVTHGPRLAWVAGGVAEESRSLSLVGGRRKRVPSRRVASGFCLCFGAEKGRDSAARGIPRA